MSSSHASVNVQTLTPHIQLYTLKAREAGEEIVEQMYAFTDKGFPNSWSACTKHRPGITIPDLLLNTEGKAVTLRPEMTPTLARMALQKQQYQSGVIQVLLRHTNRLLIYPSTNPCVCCLRFSRPYSAGAHASEMVHCGSVLAVRNSMYYE